MRAVQEADSSRQAVHGPNLGSGPSCQRDLRRYGRRRVPRQPDCTELPHHREREAKRRGMAPLAMLAQASLHSASARPYYEWIQSKMSMADAPPQGLRTSLPPRCQAKQLKLNFAWSQFTSAFETKRAPFVKKLSDEGSTMGPVVGSACLGTSVLASNVITSVNSYSISAKPWHTCAWERHRQLCDDSAVGIEKIGAWHGTSVHGRDVINCVKKSAELSADHISAGERRHQLCVGSAVGTDKIGACHGTSVHERKVINCTKTVSTAVSQSSSVLASTASSFNGGPAEGLLVKCQLRHISARDYCHHLCQSKAMPSGREASDACCSQGPRHI